MALSFFLIVPTLNSYELLPRLVSSLQAQTWKAWRLLFVDGPSSDVHRSWIKDCTTSDPRCSCVIQDLSEPGIFGAMNQGFAQAGPSDWVLFWGSDDWASGPNVLADAAIAIEAGTSRPDLLVCRGRYSDASSGALTRPTVFHSAGFLSAFAYRRSLFLGSTPPHQATLIGPGARRRLARYASGFSLSADLDYFIQLSRSSELRVQCVDLELVHMSDAGVSGRETQRRLQEVMYIYRRHFGSVWFLPFAARYIRRIVSLLSRP